MRLGGRAAAAIEVLNDIAARHRPAGDALRDWGLSHRFAGSGDRAAIGNLVYDSLRRRASQAWRMDDEDSRAAVLATLLGQWGLSADRLAADFAGDRFAPLSPSATELAAWHSRSLDAAPDAVRADVPAWTAPFFEAAFADGWVAEAAALAQRPPLDLRVNTLRATARKVERQLARHSPRPCRHAPAGLRIAPGTGDARLPNVQAEAAFRKGWFEIQDEGSQLAALACAAAPGEQLLDYCAGAGGKTLALAAAMENRGQIHAHDRDRNRLAPIHERLRRAGVRNSQVHAPDSDLSPLLRRMDCVLVDAPCTGTGTWRRRPDAKWRLDAAGLESRVAEQDAILADAARFVRPGGRLVYVTCSLLPPENAARVEAFLAATPGFALAPADASLAPLCDNALLLRQDGAMVVLTPKAAETDGFFVARLVRTA